MALGIIGAGFGRTGTLSLKHALERLLGGTCYHMVEVFAHPGHADMWRRAAEGEAVDFNLALDGYVATVDWPACEFWRELADANPDALVLLSTRSSADAWWKSAHDTIFTIATREVPADAPPVFGAQIALVTDMFARFCPDWQDETAAKRAYEEHNARVRATVDPDRLLEWQPGDGWEPICAALDVPVPDDPFPHVNSTADFRAMIGLD